MTLAAVLVPTEPERSAEPPMSSGRAGTRLSRAFLEATRVAMLSPASRAC